MSPEEVAAASVRLKDAIGRDDGEEAGMAALAELLTGACLNLARVAQHLGDAQ